ncbi:MAG: hypothetical protein J7J72_09090 [Bacteroidales bacterium]|nr:hypothetical protein [Bacteroidales bacterium]
MKKENKDIDEQMLDALIQKAMKDDFTIHIPLGFADRMEEKAKQIKLFSFWKEELFKQLALLGGIILMLAIPLGVFYYFQAESLSGILNFLNQFKWLLLGGIVFLFMVQMADSWILKKLGLNTKFNL